VLSLRQNLGAGEAECIALALEIQADLLIMDERLGRQSAQFLKIPHIGLVGVLVRAKHTGNIHNIKTILDKLCDVASFRISDSLYQRVLQDAGEL
jgi:predicted nucleic acid-binding protein